MKKFLTLSFALILGSAELASASGKPPGCVNGYYPIATKESYYPCMWQIRNIVDLFGYDDIAEPNAYEACFPTKENGKVVGYDIYPAAKGIDRGKYYITSRKLVGKPPNDRQKSSGKKIVTIEEDSVDGIEFWRVVDVGSQPHRSVAFTKKGCYLHSFNLVNADQKGHTISAETCKSIIDARKGKSASEGIATKEAEKRTTTDKSMKSALNNCDNHTTIGVLMRRNPPTQKSTGGFSSSGGSSNGKAKKAN